MVRAVRGVGWLLVASGAIVLLYVVYLLWFTNLGTVQAQRELAEGWQAQTQQLAQSQPQAAPEPEADPGLDAEADPDPDPDLDPDPEIGSENEAPEHVVEGDAYLMLWFERDGQPIVSDDPLYVVGGVGVDHLRLGPGHYPDSAAPGDDGNLGIAGHRTTYGAPFWALDELTAGDTIHVVDRDGREWVYAYREQRIVTPNDTWVVDDPDPLATGRPTITLTTCHPRFSAAQRLIAWGELVTT